MLDVDKELMRYRRSMNPDGKLYISVPTWFGRLHNFGVGGFSIEYYYDPAHVNVWSKPHFEAVLKKAGFRIIKENHAFYDNTYLCEVDPDRKETDPPISIPLPSVSQIKDWLARIKLADECCQKKQFQEALDQWPNFPIARRALYEYQRKDWDTKGIDDIMKQIIKPWLELDPDSYEACILGADVLMRYDKYLEALNYLKLALQRRPKCETSLGAISNCYRMLAKKSQNKEERINYLKQSRDIMKFMKDNCLNGFANAVTWIYSDNANIPMPSEV